MTQTIELEDTSDDDKALDLLDNLLALHNNDPDKVAKILEEQYPQAFLVISGWWNDAADE